MLKYHLYKVGKPENHICHLWHEDLETIEHILCEYVAITRIQHQHFSRPLLTPAEIQNENSRLILGFIES